MFVHNKVVNRSTIMRIVTSHYCMILLIQPYVNG